MEPSKAAMKAALRVLTALSERHEPDPADVDELHWYVPSAYDRPLDELVCDAIQRALKDREQQRKVIQDRLRERALALHSAPPPAAPAPEADLEKRRNEHALLTAKLKELGIAMQQAAATLTAVDSVGYTADSGEAQKALQSIGRDVDLSKVVELLNEHARLTRQLAAEQQAPKSNGSE